MLEIVISTYLITFGEQFNINIWKTKSITNAMKLKEINIIKTQQIMGKNGSNKNLKK